MKNFQLIQKAAACSNIVPFESINAIPALMPSGQAPFFDIQPEPEVSPLDRKTFVFNSEGQDASYFLDPKSNLREIWSTARRVRHTLYVQKDGSSISQQTEIQPDGNIRASIDYRAPNGRRTPQ